MRLLKSGVLPSLFLFASILALRLSPASAQEKSGGADRSGVSAAKKSSDTKKQALPEEPTGTGEQSSVEGIREDGDSAEQIRKREEWFYQQRAFPLGHIPAGARFKAFQHMQRMMEAEGKLVRRPDGSFKAVSPEAAVAPQGAVSSPWKPIGPAPTTGGFFSPVTGRVTTIAVDPSDSTGNTVLIGGAQGGIWRSIDAGITWTAVGDSNPSLAMGSIAFANPSSPGGAGVVYAGTGEQASVGFDVYYGAGVLKSTDHGLTWTQTCTVPGPTCPFIGPYSGFTLGFYSDGGARISYIAVNPSNPNLVLVAAHIPQTGVSLTAGGVYCSDDGGSTWSSIPSASGEMATFVGFANATTAYAALGRTSGSLAGANPNGIYKSINADGKGSTGTLPPKCGNITFSNLTTNGIAGLPASSLGRIDLGIAPADTAGKTVYASIADASIDPVTGRSRSSRTNLGVFKTVDGGNTWTNTNAPDICQRQCWYDNVIKVDPSDSNVVFFGGGAHILISSTSFTFEWVIRSTDGGTTWNPAVPTPSAPGDPALPHVDEHALAFARNGSTVRLYLGNDGGVWRTDDAKAATVSWTNLNNFPLQLTQFYPSLSIHPSNPGLGFAGTQDNGSQNFSGAPNPTNDWTDNRSCGDGGWTLIDPATPSTVYVLCQVLLLKKSVTNGTPGSFRFAVNGIDFTDPVNFIAPMAIDPANSNRLYFGTNKVYQTVDGADNWQALNSASPLSSNGVIVALGVGGSNNGNVVYAGTSDGQVFVSANVAPGSANFSPVAGQSQLPPRHPTQIIVDPSHPTGNTAYLTFSGFSGFSDQLGHIFKTLDGGATWTDVSCTRVGNCGQPNPTDLPNIPVNDLVIDPDVPGTLYAATDLGVFMSSNGGVSWSPLNNSFPNVAVLSLKLHEPSRTLRAATHGRGAWDIALTNFAFTGPHIANISPTSANVGDPQTSLAVNGSGFTCGSKIVFALNGATDTLTPTFCSAAQLVTVIPGSDVQASGDAQVTVTDPGPPAATSNAMTFTVLAPAPLLISVNPASTPVQTPNPTADVPIQLAGAGFISGSKVFWNGQQNGITTTFTDSQHITATLPKALLGPFGSTNDITVVNPPPGGGKSFLIQPFVVVAPPPPNDDPANAITIASNSFSDTEDSSGATTEAGANASLASCVRQFTPAQGNTGGHPNGLYNTIWYKFVAPSRGSVQIDTNGSSYDTVLDVRASQQGNATVEVEVACNDDINPGVVLTSQVNFDATGGTTYSIMVGSFGPPDPNPVALGGKSVLNFSFVALPDFAITSSGTTTQTITAGQTATFTNAISVTAQNGFAAQVNLSCSIIAAATTCSVNPASFSTGSGTASVMVTTMARGFAPPVLPRGRFIFRPQFLPTLVLLMLLAAFLVRFARTRRQRLAGALPLVGLLLFLMLQAIGCGGGSSTPPSPTGTPAGTYIVTVTATASTSSGPLTHTTTLTLVVQ